MEPTAIEVQEPELKAKSITACGNCGRRIMPGLGITEVYNTRNRGYEHFHEDYRGCYEATREHRVALPNRMRPWLNLALEGGAAVVFPNKETETEASIEA